MRVIPDETFNALIQLLAKDEKVKIYASLLLSEKIDNPPETDEKTGAKK